MPAQWSLPAEEAANIRFAAWQTTQPTIPVGLTIQFQIRCDGNSTCVNFQAKPKPAVLRRLRTPAAGAHHTVRKLTLPTLLLAQVSPTSLKVSREQSVHSKSR